MSRNTGRSRRSKNTVTTKSGNSIKVNRSISDRVKARKAARNANKAAYLSTLPKEPLKRFFARLEPKHLAEYWFSKDGGMMALKIIGIAIVIGFFLTIGMFAYFRKDLPKVKDLSGDAIGGNITYYDRSGQTVLFNDYDTVKRIAVDSKDMSPYIRQATIAIEDKDFYKHGAFDVRGIMRAAVHDVTGSSGTVQGGSTITQQLVKLNQNWTQNRTITRKVKELILAVELEREYSKDDVLTGYLNIAPYGGQEYGVESAARDYFQTTAKNLTLPQATMLAAIPQSPSYYSPYAGSKYNEAVTSDTFSPTALLNRQHYILDQMAKQGYITQKQADEAKQVDVLAQIKPQAPKFAGIKAPYFVLAAKQELSQTYGATTVQRGGWKVITTLDMDKQNKAEQLVASNLANVKRYGADEEAVVLEEVQTGQMLALVGGTNFDDPDHGQNNYAAGISIPPGSSFKPYDYVAMINNNNNVGAGSVLYDVATPLPGYPCTNKNKPKQGGNCLQDYDFKYPGPVTLRYALGGSRNVPAVKAMYSAVPNDKSPSHVDSVNKTIKTASAMMDNKYHQSRKENSYKCYQPGVDVNIATRKDETQCYGSAAIGDGAYLKLDDHVNGLATLARMGQAIPRTYILKITDSGGKDVYTFKQPKAKQVVKADAAFIVNDMAADPKASYLPGSCNATSCTPLRSGGYKFHKYNGWNVAIKTGTTNDGYDGLMASWTPKYAVVSWVGHHTRRVNLRNSMEALTEPMTRGLMEYSLGDSKPGVNSQPPNWTAPKTIKTSPAFIVRNHIGVGSVEPSPTNDLYPGWYVGNTQAKKTTQVMDKVSNKVATTCTPPLAKDSVSGSNAASWNADIFNGGKNSIGTTSSGSAGSSANDDVHNCNDSPPTVTLTTPPSCDVVCTITATVTQGTHKLTDEQYAQYPGTVTITLNGQTINSSRVKDSPSTISFEYRPSSNGSGTVVATVTDSVLYQGSDRKDMAYNSAAPISLVLRGSTSNSASIEWSGGTNGPFTAYLNESIAGSCQNVSSGSCTVNGLAPGSRIYVRDSAGTASNTISAP